MRDLGFTKSVKARVKGDSEGKSVWWREWREKCFVKSVCESLQREGRVTFQKSVKS